MSRAWCGVCQKDWLDECECETIARGVFDAARSAWARSRYGVIEPEDVAALDAVFFAGDECHAAPVVPTAEHGEDGCT